MSVHSRFGAFLVGTAFGGLLALASPAAAQEAGSITGTVVTASGSPAGRAQVLLVDLRRNATADADGVFRFDGVPPGTYLLEATSLRFGQSVSRVELRSGEPARVELRLDVDVHHESVIVTAQPDARSASELAQPVTVLAGEALRLRMEPTLGETLSHLPGVSSTYFGPGASRPIIRGIGGDRIRILEDGIGSFDASSSSPDHAVSYDPIGLDRVEVVRGPATLLYGSSAVGGVVNTIDRRIPDSASDHLASGAIDLTLGSVSDEKSGAGALQIGRGPFIVRGEYARRDTGNLDIPGFAESAILRALEHAEEEEHDEEGGERAEEEEAFGTLPNSAIESESAGVSAGFVGRNGFIGVAARGFDTLYGVPGGHGHAEEGEHDDEEEGEEEEHAEEGPVRIDMQQRRLDLRAGYNEPFGAFRAAKIRFGVADYQHVELEGDEIGTIFDNQGWEGRVEMLHQPLARSAARSGPSS